MSYASVLRNIPEFMGQPAGVAALASLGIHGAIALILPLVPVNTSNSDKQINIPKPVGVTALSPKEQARLPQTAIANPLAAKATPMQPQLGVSAQLPPLPSYSSQNATPLPPLPAFSDSSTSTSLPPLPDSTNVNVPMFPRGQQRVASGNFKIDTGFKPSPLARRNYPTNIGNPIIGDTIAMQPRPGAPVNIPDFDDAPRTAPIAPPPISSPLPEGVPAGMAPQNGNIATGIDTGMDGNNPVPGSNELTTPVGQPFQGEGDFSLANQAIPGVGNTPSSGLTPAISAALANNGINSPETGATNPGGANSETNNSRATKATIMAAHYQQAQKSFPLLQTGKPTSVKMDRDGLKEVVDVGLVVKADGTIDEFKAFASDDRPLSYEDNDALRKFLADYLKQNPPANAGKPVYLTFNVAPRGAGETAQTPSETVKPLENNTAPTVSNNREQPLAKPMAGFEVLRRDGNLAPANPNPQADSSFSEPLRLRDRPAVPIPTRNPQLETTPRSTAQSAPESSKPTKIESWRDRLTPDKSKQSNSESSGIQKLRQLAEIRNKSNP